MEMLPAYLLNNTLHNLHRLCFSHSFDDSGQLSTKIYDKHFKIINFPIMCSNIPASPAYGVYISQLIRYARASSNYSDFLKRHLYRRNRLTRAIKIFALFDLLKGLYSDTKILSKNILFL